MAPKKASKAGGSTRSATAKSTGPAKPSLPPGVTQEQLHASAARADARHAARQKAKGGLLGGISWKEVLICVVLAFPLAILYRQVLVPFLANMSFVRDAKSKGLQAIARDTLGSIGISQKMLDGWFTVVLSKLVWVGLLPWWALIILVIVIILGIGALEACCIPDRTRNDSPMASASADDAELRKLEQEVDEVLAEMEADIAEMEANQQKAGTSGSGAGANPAKAGTVRSGGDADSEGSLTDGASDDGEGDVIDVAGSGGAADVSSVRQRAGTSRASKTRQGAARAAGAAGSTAAARRGARPSAVRPPADPMPATPQQRAQNRRQAEAALRRAAATKKAGKAE